MKYSEEEVKKLAQQFSEEHRSSLAKFGNALTCGVGKENETGEYCIFAYLETDHLVGHLPTIYQGIRVIIKVVGPITAL